MLASQFRSGGRGTSAKAPFVFFYHLGDLLEIAVDEKTYGNDSRFCRRSSNFNAELRHVLDKGSLHLFIVAVKNVEKNQEILLPIDNALDSSLPSISADLREIKKPMNGLLNTSTDDEPLASRDLKERKKKKERKKTKKGLPEDSPVSGRKTRGQQHPKSPKIESEIKTEIKQEPATSEEVKASPEKFVSLKVKKEEDEEVECSDVEKQSPLVNGLDKQQPPSPVKVQQHKIGPQGGPSMLGLPDNKGLIVGVNTINYDASSSVKNKAKVTATSS